MTCASFGRPLDRSSGTDARPPSLKVLGAGQAAPPLKPRLRRAKGCPPASAAIEEHVRLLAQIDPIETAAWIDSSSLWLEGRRGRRRSQGGQPLQEQTRLVGVALESIDGGADVLVAPALVEAQGVRVAGPGEEPERLGAFRHSQGFRPGEELLADAFPQEGALNVETIQLGGAGVRRQEGVGLIVGELREAHQVVRDLGDQDTAPRIGKEDREGFLRQVAPGFPRDRGPDALDSISIEKDLGCQDAQAESVALDSHPAGDLGATLHHPLLRLVVSLSGPSYRYDGL